MNSISTWIKILLVSTFLWSCGSGEVVPTTDKCTIKKHWKDSLYQVRINGTPINKHWYLQRDAIDIARKLSEKNKCMP